MSVHLHHGDPIAAAAFAFLPGRAALDLLAGEDFDLFSHS